MSRAFTMLRRRANVLELRNVFDLIMKGFDEGWLTQQQCIDRWPPWVVHVLAGFSHPVQTGLPKFMEQSLRKTAAIADPWAGQPGGPCGEGCPIVHIAGGNLEGQKFARVVDDERPLETVKPAP